MLKICLFLVLTSLPFYVAAGPTGAIHVIDADTWDIDGQRVRLFAVDAPEAGQTCTNRAGAIWPCGDWATKEVQARYQGETARCSSIDTDRYGRIVARCAVDGTDVGRVLVSEGLALAYRRYSLDYDQDEKAAAQNARGIHRGRFQPPSEYRAARAKGPAAPDPTCRIKGNISSKGVRIYHLPGQSHYVKTRISTVKNERWFCSESEARTAGWRRAKR